MKTLAVTVLSCNLVSCFVSHYLDPRNVHQVPLQHLKEGSVSVQDSLDAGIMRSYFHFPYIEHNEAINDCQYLPNNTEIKPHFYQCKEDTTVRLHGGALTNLTGDDHYPVTFNDSIRIFLDVTSSSSRRFDNLGIEVDIYKRSTGWFGCGWISVPSLGMLNDYDICSNNAFCPLVPGRQVIEFSVDPTPLFTRLFRMIHHDLSAYQLIIRLRDNSEPFNELLCATIQTRIQL